MRAAACVAAAAACLAVAAHAAPPPFVGDPSTCPSGTNTACTGNATCCKMKYSGSGYGCCHLPNAVCCDRSHTIMPTGDPVQNCCPENYRCVQTGTYSATCVPPPATPPRANESALAVCTPGPRYAPTDKGQNPGGLKSCLVIGDSVSIGYTPNVIAALNASGTCYVQHSPWAGGGGAASTGNGLNCIEEFLRTSSYQEVRWDAIFFNFGLHNLGNDTASEQQYAQQLTAITERLVTTGSKLLYGLTTPQMDFHRAGNFAVEDDNKAAAAIMAAHKVPVLDLYTVITDHCGKVYTDCDICRVEPCSYHYKPAGYQLLGDAVAAGIAKLLQS